MGSNYITNITGSEITGMALSEFGFLSLIITVIGILYTLSEDKKGILSYLAIHVLHTGIAGFILCLVATLLGFIDYGFGAPWARATAYWLLINTNSLFILAIIILPINIGYELVQKTKMGLRPAPALIKELRTLVNDTLAHSSNPYIERRL